MDDRQIEERLRRVRLAEPDPALRVRLIAAVETRMSPRRGGAGEAPAVQVSAAAETRMSQRARPTRFPWALAAAAALLIAANLVFGQVHGARIRALVGEPATVTAADAQVYAQAIAERARLMSEMIATPHIDADGGETHGERQLPDLQTNRTWTDPRVA